jgi:hypothetical protein
VGLSHSKCFGISRQTAHELVHIVSEKVEIALNEGAKLHRIEPKQIDISKGLLLGWSREFRTEAVVELNPQSGLQVWYKHNLGECGICPDRGQCKSMLLKSAENLEVSLTREEKRMEPSELSMIVFSRASGRESQKT